MDFILADVLQFELSPKGLVKFQVGDFATSEVITDDVELIGPSGYIGLPCKPSSSGNAQAVILQDGSNEFVKGFREARTSGAYGNLSWGEVAIFALGPNATGQGRIIMKDDGTTSRVSIVVKKGNDPGGAVSILQMASDENITISNSKGQVIQMNSNGDTVMTNKDGKASFTLLANGDITVAGNNIFLQGQTNSLNGQTALAMSDLVKAEFTKVAACFKALTSPSGPVTGQTYTTAGDVGSKTAFAG